MGHKTITWRGMIFISVAMLLLFAVAMVRETNHRNAMEAQYDQRQQGIVQQEQQLASLRNELARVGTDGYVENEARERYDYVREGEVRFVFSAPEKLTYYTEDEWEIIMDEELYPTY